MGFSHLGLFVCAYHVLVLGVLASASSRNLPIISFDEGYNKLFGDDNLMILRDGKSVHLSLDERTGVFRLVAPGLVYHVKWICLLVLRWRFLMGF